MISTSSFTLGKFNFWLRLNIRFIGYSFYAPETPLRLRY
jgi:hypothetical protein